MWLRSSAILSVSLSKEKSVASANRPRAAACEGQSNKACHSESWTRFPVFVRQKKKRKKEKKEESQARTAETFTRESHDVSAAKVMCVDSREILHTCEGAHERVYSIDASVLFFSRKVAFLHVQLTY